MKVVITGARGQLGTDLAGICRAAGDDVVGVDLPDFDVCDEGATFELLESARPDVVVNCAAITDVDACESEVELATAVNERAVRTVAEACDRFGSRLVHISTDYVFDGTLDRPYREDDTPNPRSVYGRTKLAGEHAALEVLGERTAILRTSWVCGAHGNNMVKTVLRLAGERELAPGSLAFVDDQRGCPTFTIDLAAAVRTIARIGDGGLFHVTNSGAVSWYEFVREILDVAGHDPSSVRPITTAELDPPRPAPRPANSVLDNVAWRAAGHEPLRHHVEPLRELVADLT
jgi:dTDP-4-dehydrorhamnose reductase